MIDRVVERASADQDRRDDAARGALDEPPQLGLGGAGSTARPDVAPTCEPDVLDRVGGGDGFASGFFYGLLTGEVARGVRIKLGWARRRADQQRSRATPRWRPWKQVRALAKGGSARIQR